MSSFFIALIESIILLLGLVFMVAVMGMIVITISQYYMIFKMRSVIKDNFILMRYLESDKISHILPSTSDVYDKTFNNVSLSNQIFLSNYKSKYDVCKKQMRLIIKTIGLSLSMIILLSITVRVLG